MNITLDRAAIREIETVLGLDQIRQMARQYAAGYDADRGDTIREYVDRVSRDVYPASLSRLNGQRAEFKRLVRGFIRGRK